MSTQTWLAVFNARHTKYSALREKALASRDMESADRWHRRCMRLTGAISYLETRVSR